MKIARISEKDDRNQSVEDHLRNVGLYCEKSGEKIGLKNVLYLAGILHDMGKLSNDFQEYILKANSMQEGNKKTHAKKVDHAVYGAKYIYDKYRKEDGIKKITSQLISLVICYHHGGLPDVIVGNDKISIIERMNKINKVYYMDTVQAFEEIYGIDEIDEKFKLACQEVTVYLGKMNTSKDKPNKKSFQLHLLIKIIYSILIDADWMDSYLFELNEKKYREMNIQDNIELYILNIRKKMEDFKQIRPISNKQKIVFSKRNEIAENCLKFSNNKTGIYTLTVPTGGGKTLSSLYFAVNHAKKHNKERIFYIAPYTSIIEQNAQEIKETLQCEEKLLEYHSNIFNKSEDNKLEKYDDNKEDKILTDRWNYQFICTTMVQFLNTLYAGPTHNIRRYRSLSNSIIIFDEIQTIPIHSISLFNESINFLSQFLNTTIVLCTATQPTLNSLNRPVIFEEDHEMVKDVNDAFEKLNRVGVIDKTKKQGFTYEEVKNFIIKLKSNNKSVLVIVNTIKTATEIYSELKKNNCKKFLLSSNLCPSHRKEIVRDIKEALKNKEDIICISTQVMEAGIDLSFDSVIRSIAGIDSIAQAAGRCNRHGEKDKGYTYIVNFDKEHENTTKIETMELGKIKTEGILDIYKNEPESFENNLLSPSIIKKYFSSFYIEENIKRKFDHPINNGENTIYELLSNNAKKMNVYNAYSNREYRNDLLFSFQFKEAREKFYVIEDKTKTIIVPYKEGEDVIAELNSSKSLSEKISCLKRAQNYCVNIYDNVFNKLYKEGAISNCEIEGIYILNGAYYNDEKGVSLKKELRSLQF